MKPLIKKFPQSKAEDFSYVKENKIEIPLVPNKLS